MYALHLQEFTIKLYFYVKIKEEHAFYFKCFCACESVATLMNCQYLIVINHADSVPVTLCVCVAECHLQLLRYLTHKVADIDSLITNQSETVLSFTS